MNILITGATGLIGRALVKKLQGHSIIILTRNITKAKQLFHDEVTYTHELPLVDFNLIDVVINLAGEPIANKRWTPSQKKSICDSRWKITQQLAHQINAATTPPTTFISGSAIGVYGRQSAKPITEKYPHFHKEFSYKVCQTWESIALSAQSDKTRVCLLRTGIVLDRNNGALSKMLPAFKLGLGGPISSGKQYMSWIHIDDMVEVILATIYNKTLEGAINATSPNALSNKEFSKKLSGILHRPCFFKVPKSILTLLLGEMSDLLLYGQNVVPDKLLNNNFVFKYPALESALENLLSERKKTYK